MDLVQIDRVDPQPAQAPLARLHDVLPRQAGHVRPLPHGEVHFGRDHDLVACTRWRPRPALPSRLLVMEPTVPHPPPLRPEFPPCCTRWRWPECAPPAPLPFASGRGVGPAAEPASHDRTATINGTIDVRTM